MRLDPVDRPPTLLARVATAMMRRQLGKVITPARVIYNRVPRMYAVAWQLVKLQRQGLTLDPELRLLIMSWVAMVNRCSFCVDIGRAMALREGLSLEKLHALPGWRTSVLFDDRERAALAYAEEATRERRVDDETFAALRKHFDDRQIAEITVVTAVENFYNLLNLPLGIEEDGLCAIAEGRRRAS
jgi:AhpD family alkylhydroperoxidase